MLLTYKSCASSCNESCSEVLYLVLESSSWTCFVTCGDCAFQTIWPTVDYWIHSPHVLHTQSSCDHFLKTTEDLTLQTGFRLAHFCSHFHFLLWFHVLFRVYIIPNTIIPLCIVISHFFAVYGNVFAIAFIYLWFVSEENMLTLKVFVHSNFFMQQMQLKSANHFCISLTCNTKHREILPQPVLNWVMQLINALCEWICAAKTFCFAQNKMKGHHNHV